MTYNPMCPPQRVLIIGSGGAGKSTFAKKLSAKTGIPMYHLDALYWQPGWQEPPREAWQKKVDALLAEEQWIMDGNFGGTLERRVPRADLIVLFDIPSWRCMWNVLKRRIKHNGFSNSRTRPDMAPGCPETLDLKFVLWVLMYPKRNKPKVLETIRKHKQINTELLIFSNYKAVDEFLAAL